MCNKIEKILKVTVGTTAQSVKVNGLTCLVQNLTAESKIYIKEKSGDGKAVTTATGFCIPGGTTLEVPLVATELSVISDTAGTDVRVMILDLG